MEQCPALAQSCQREFHSIDLSDTSQDMLAFGLSNTVMAKLNSELNKLTIEKKCPESRNAIWHYQDIERNNQRKPRADIGHI